MLGAGIKRTMDCDYVAFLHHRPSVRMIGHIEFPLHGRGEAVVIGIMQLDIEWLEPPQDRLADAAGRDGSHVHSLEIVRSGDAIGDIPSSFDYPLIRWNVVPHQRKNHHYHVLGNADAIGISYFGDGDL